MFFDWDMTDVECHRDVVFAGIHAASSCIVDIPKMLRLRIFFKVAAVPDPGANFLGQTARRYRVPWCG